MFIPTQERETGVQYRAKKKKIMDWFKKHADSVATITILVTAIVWMHGRFKEIDRRFSNLEKDIAIITTVLVMKEILPKELAVNADN